MSLKAVLIDKAALISHGNWNEPLQKLLLGLRQYGAAVIDISHIGNPYIDAGDANSGDKEIVQDKIKSHGLSFRDCLMIADCQAAIQRAKAWNTAVLGYQSEADHESVLSDLDLIVEGFDEVDFQFLERVYQRFHHLPWTIRETERCILREMTLEDLNDLYEIYKPEEITRYIDGLHENCKEEEEFTKAYIENMYRYYGYGMWVVIEKATGRLIGRAGISHFETKKQIQLELGYMIAQEKQNQGYATEVCRAILGYVKDELRIPSVCCRIQKENLVSIHLAEKLGFHLEKRVKYNEKEMGLYVKKFSH